jgi:hypothetical protein
MTSGKGRRKSEWKGHASRREGRRKGRKEGRLEGETCLAERVFTFVQFGRW